MPALNNQSTYTIDDIFALPDGERAELIDGVMYDMAQPSGEHQRISISLSTQLYNHIQKNKGNCQVYYAPYAVFLNDDDYNYVEPDIAVICDKKKLDDEGCHGAPDFIIEIVSPSSRKMDYMIKMIKYQKSGVREYWIVDPLKQNVRTYDFMENETADYSFGEDIPVAIYPGFSMSIPEQNM